jgi:hypothetical protein
MDLVTWPVHLVRLGVNFPYQGTSGTLAKQEPEIRGFWNVFSNLDVDPNY